MKQLSFVFIAGLFLTACNSGLGSQEAEAVTTTPTTFAAPNVVNNATLPADSQQSSAGAAATVKLNPAHGQPGHSCDLPEGAPLNSAPIPNGVIPAGGGINMQPAPAVSSPVAGKRLNPAHGQPGHDCAVPVGQPLN